MDGKVIKYISRINRWRKEHISNANFLLILSAIVGILGGCASSLLKKLTHVVAGYLQDGLVWQYKYYFYFILPLIGIFLARLYIKLFIRRHKFQKGIPYVLSGISRNSSKLDFHNIYSQIFTSAITVGLGGSAGLESPSVVSGSAIGSNVGRFFGLSYRETTLLLAGGAAAGISGAFDSPVAGMIFAIEVILPEFSIPAVIPLLIASALSSVVSWLLYNKPLFALVTESWAVSSFWYFVLMGLLMGFFTIYYSVLNDYMFKVFEKMKRQYSRVLIGGIAVGILVGLMPALYGEGYITIQKLLDGKYESILQNSLFSSYQHIGWAILLFAFLTLMGKTVASVTTMACGGNGGMFGPSVGVGGLFGFVFAYGLNLTGWVDLNVTNFMIAGMAASISGLMHAPMTGIFLAAEITGGYTLMVPLMVVSALSFFINKSILKYSIYTKPLSEKGNLYIEEGEDKGVLQRLKLRYLLEKDFVVLHPDDTPQNRKADIVGTHRNVFPVVDANGILTGILYSEDLLDLLIDNDESVRRTPIQDIMRPVDVTLNIHASMQEVVQKMEKADTRLLPVTGKDKMYLGFVTKARLFNEYRQYLMKRSDFIE